MVKVDSRNNGLADGVEPSKVWHSAEIFAGSIHSHGPLGLLWPLRTVSGHTRDGLLDEPRISSRVSGLNPNSTVGLVHLDLHFVVARLESLAPTEPPVDPDPIVQAAVVGHHLPINPKGRAIIRLNAEVVCACSLDLHLAVEDCFIVTVWCSSDILQQCRTEFWSIGTTGTSKLCQTSPCGYHGCSRS